MEEGEKNSKQAPQLLLRWGSRKLSCSAAVEGGTPGYPENRQPRTQPHWDFNVRCPACRGACKVCKQELNTTRGPWLGKPLSAGRDQCKHSLGVVTLPQLPRLPGTKVPAGELTRGNYKTKGVGKKSLGQHQQQDWVPPPRPQEFQVLGPAERPPRGCAQNDCEVWEQSKRIKFTEKEQPGFLVRDSRVDTGMHPCALLKLLRNGRKEIF